MNGKTAVSIAASKPKFQSLILRPLANGLLGFVLFFVIILALKILSNTLDPAGTILIETEDLLLAMIGFVLLFLISFLKNFQEPGR